MKRKRGIAKRKPKQASLTKEGNPNLATVNTQDEWNLDDYNNNEVNGTKAIEGLQNQNVVDLAVEDRTSSFRGLNVAVSTSLLKKARSKTSKSSNALSSSNTKQTSNVGIAQIGETGQGGPELPNQDPEYKEEELKFALEVIRKVMKMDAAEPFNVPVDPVAQGIPDYFDIIHTPMDFSTICSNIEHGVKYKNSKDVMRDVQYIWDNCSRYNRKGHFILELMKRVKRNFTKYWTEAGLCKEQQQEIDDNHFPPSQPTTSGNIYGHKSPLASLANCARSLQQDGEDLTSPHLDQPSLACSESYKSQQRPGHHPLGYAEATLRRNPHDTSMDPLDYGFAHPHPRQNLHEISQSQSSLWRNEPYQPQQRSCQCHPIPLQPQHTYHQASAFNSSAGHPHMTHLTEPTVRGSPRGHWSLESHHAESSSFSHQKKISYPPEFHDHQSSLRPYPPQRDFCPCFQCSRHADGNFDLHRAEHWNVNYTNQEPRNSKHHMTDFTRHRPQDQIASKTCDVEENFDSHRSGHRNVSCTNQVPRNSKRPMSDFTSHHRSQDQIASKTCGVGDEHFSPPPTESMVTVAKREAAKYPAVSTTQIINRELLDEITLNQSQPDTPDEPQLESCQGQSSSEPQTSPPQPFSDMFQGVSKKTKKKNGYRGPTRCLKVFDTEDKIPITTNEDGEPIGPEAPKLISFLGVIARNGHVAPLTYVKWKALPEEDKEKMWQLVQSKFVINPESKIWVLKSLAKKWTTWKAALKVNHYNPHKTDEERLADCNERVLPEQWRILVEFWNTPEAQVVSNRNKANRSHMKLYHAAGSKSFARLREEQRLKRPDGKEPSQADLFILTRTRKNGQPVTETSSKIISRLRDAAQQKQGTSQQDTIENDVFVQVLGEDKRKRKRGQANGLGPAPLNTLSPEAEKIVSEAKAEVLEMKEKMVAVEQTCAQMAAQMATMMSMMQKNFAATNTPNLDASVEESEHVSASHNNFQTLKRSATKNGKKPGVVKGARREP